MAPIAQDYRRQRRENPRLPAVAALGIARRRQDPAWARDLDEGRDGSLAGEVRGWDIKITARPDDCPDTSWLGTFTDNPDGAVPNPEYQHGRYRYFRPCNVPSVEDYRHSGLSRDEAQRAVQEAMKEDAQLALATQYVVTVTASREGIELGSSVLGGVFADGRAELLWTVDEHGMADEAISEAEAALTRLAATR